MSKKVRWFELTKVVDGIIGVCLYQTKDKSGVVRIREELENDTIMGKVSFTHGDELLLDDKDKTFIQKDFHNLLRS